MQRLRLVLDPSVIEREVEPAEPLDHLRHGGFDLPGYRHVARDRQHLAAGVSQGLTGLLQRVHRPIEYGDARTFRSEAERSRAADAAGRAGDESNLAGEAIGPCHDNSPSQIRLSFAGQGRIITLIASRSFIA